MQLPPQVKTILLVVGLSVLFNNCSPVHIPKSTGQGSTVPSRDDNLTLGNPSGASVNNPANYLITRRQYTLSYNRDRGLANCRAAGAVQLAFKLGLEGQQPPNQRFSTRFKPAYGLVCRQAVGLHQHRF